MTFRIVLFVLLAVSALSAQPAVDSSLHFEVASIRKVEGNPVAARMASGSLFLVDNSHVRFTAVNVATLIRYAYRLKAYQLDLSGNSGDALDPDSPNLFNVECTLPHGSKNDQVPAMMRSLLADRFGLMLETTTKQLDSYTLIVGKDGIRFEATDTAPDWELPAFTAPKVNADPSGGMSMVSGGLKTTTQPGKPQRIEATTLDDLTDFLSLKLQSPVLNKTGFMGRYKIVVDIPVPDLSTIAPGGGARPDRAAMMEAMAAPVFPAIERIGLKLQHGKNPVEVISVKHINPSPTEN